MPGRCAGPEDTLASGAEPSPASEMYLRGTGCGSSIYRRNSEWHLFDIRGAAGVIADGSASVLSSNLYDNFGTEMYASGSAATQWRFVGRFVEEEGLVAATEGGGDMLVARGVALAPIHPPKKGGKDPCTKFSGPHGLLHLCGHMKGDVKMAVWWPICSAACKVQGLLVQHCCCGLPGGAGKGRQWVIAVCIRGVWA